VRPGLHLKREALYYPFHLCHESTLRRLLDEYQVVHFMDYMALRLTEMSGTTAYQDRMGDTHPDQLAAGKIVQGHSVGGPLDPDLAAAVDQDLSDHAWRAAFHDALLEDRRFQRGLFNLAHGVLVGAVLVPGPAALLGMTAPSRVDRPFTVEDLRRLSRDLPSGEGAYDYEYGFALVKTAASLRRAAVLCADLGLEGATDSPGHYRLFEITRARVELDVTHRCLDRPGALNGNEESSRLVGRDSSALLE
jgi:hypothetical protein